MYDFKQLSPADFEELTRDLLQQDWQVRLEAFKTGRDKGIDLRYAVVPQESVIVQCKHFANSTISSLTHEIGKKELPKIKRLAPQRYVLVTSLRLGPADKDKIRNAASPYIHSTHDILGAEDLNNLLGLHSEIETQHFKLWLSSTAVLHRVLQNAERVQTEFDVERVRRAIPLYVQTGNYTRALKIIEEHNFVIISGVPGIGKTTLADILLYTHLNSGYRPVVIKSDIREGRTQLDSERRQIFYFDDFLGETFLGNRFDFLGKKEDSAILDFIDIIASSKHARLILTTREHILRHALQISERFRRNKGRLSEHQCILELSDYNLLDRGRILYNHIYFSDLPRAYKLELLENEFYMIILKHRNFNPRLIEWLSHFTNVKGLQAIGYRSAVERILENPEELWQMAFEQQISEGSRSMLLALYSLGGNAHLDRLELSWKALHKYRSKKYNWGMAAEDWRRSLQEMEGGFLRFENRSVTFVNPSVKDFLDATLTRHTEHLDDLLSSANSFEQVVNIWSLAMSEKGADLQEHFRKSSEQLINAIQQNLLNPHQERIDIKGGSALLKRDVRPEARLRTILSIAERTKSTSTLKDAIAYTSEVLKFWLTQAPDFSAAVGILRALGSGTWSSTAKLELRRQIQDVLLAELSRRAKSSDLVLFESYAGDKTSDWLIEDLNLLIRAFQNYLENEFHDELAECETPGEAKALSRALFGLGTTCSVDIEPYDAEIDEYIDQMERNEYEDDREVQHWDKSNEPMSEWMQEAEVRRLFEGLI